MMERTDDRDDHAFDGDAPRTPARDDGSSPPAADPPELDDRAEYLRDGAHVEAARAGDQHAFTPLFDRWFGPVYDVALGILRSREVAAEVAQDTFLTAWKSLGALREPSTFGAWVLRIGRNKALN